MSTGNNTNEEPNQLSEYHDIFGIEGYVVFRNAASLAAVIIQVVVLFLAFLVLIGVVYVLFVIISIVIYHCLYDRDPTHVPDFVKQSAQFSSSSSDDTDFDDEEIDAILKFQERRRSHAGGGKSNRNIYDKRGAEGSPAKSYRSAMIDKFMNTYNPKSDRSHYH